MTGTCNPLRSRQDLIRAAAELLRPLTSCMTPGKARIYVGNGSAHYSEDVAGMECWSRALWALVPMLAGKCPEAEKLWPLWQEGLIRGTDPADTEYWGDIRDSDQRMVEMAVIGCGLSFAPDAFLAPLNGDRRENLFRWLNQINRYDMPKNNWRFFRILVNIGFLKNGMPVDTGRLQEDMDLMESHYTADGWYFDYPTKRDYYTLWGFHFYSLLYAALMDNEDPERCRRIRERAALIAPRFACWFDREGRGLPYGRSLTYRFCQSSFWAAMAFAGVHSDRLGMGQVKHLLLNNLRFWLSRPIFDRGGAPLRRGRIQCPGIALLGDESLLDPGAAGRPSLLAGGRGGIPAAGTLPGSAGEAADHPGSGEPPGSGLHGREPCLGAYA